MKIDIHTHYIPRDCFDIIKRDGLVLGPTIGKSSTGEEVLVVNGKAFGATVAQLCDPERRLRDMDEMGIDMQVLSLVGHSFFYDIEPEIGLSVSRQHNDAIAEIVTAYPDRFVGMGTLPMQDIGSTVQELERVVRELKLRAVEIGSNICGKDLDDPRFWPLYEKVQELDIPIFVHPTSPPGGARLQKYFMSHIAAYPMETALVIARVTFGGILQKFPRLNFIFSHGGGGTVFIMGRWDHAHRYAEECQTIPLPPSDYVRQMYFDTIVHSTEALEYLVKMVGDTHLLLGSDYPFSLMDVDPVNSVLSSGLPAASKEAILEHNVAVLLKLDDI